MGSWEESDEGEARATLSAHLLFPLLLPLRRRRHGGPVHPLLVLPLPLPRARLITLPRLHLLAPPRLGRLALAPPCLRLRRRRRTPRLRESFSGGFQPPFLLPQPTAALKFSYRGDRVTRA